MPSVRRALLPLTAALAVAGAGAGCTSGGSSVVVAAPTPEGDAARACRELARDLPGRVAEQERGSLDQDSPYAAAWGDPAIVLRCGVERPAVLLPGGDDDRTPDEFEVNGVGWVLEDEPGGVRCTTTARTVYVEVTVPDDYAALANPLVDLSAPVADHIPLDPRYVVDR